MKKILIAAALMAAAVMPATPSMAAGDSASSQPAVDAKCFVLPLLPDCVAAWKAESDSMLSKVSAPVVPKTTAMVTPKLPSLPGMPTCTRAAAGAGHLFDCQM